jgi:nicotinate-nucleotide adenylyltransferase
MLKGRFAMKKVGIMGGTFNPVHYGHLFLAENALEQYKLDEVLFMPSKNPPHKNKQDIVSNEHRADMVRLAIQDNSNFILSTMEYEREGTTYTADTLTILTEENPDTQYYFIIGADSLFMMQDWNRPEIIFNLCTVLVAGRDRVPENQMENQIRFLEETYGARILMLDMPAIEISSAIIRKRISENKTIRYYIPDKVMDYIENHELYKIVPED